MRAFVSYIQAYSKHECYLLFRIKGLFKTYIMFTLCTASLPLFDIFPDLDFAKVAEGFALLKMPYMPELRGKKIQGFEACSIDVKSIPYK